MIRSSACVSQSFRRASLALAVALGGFALATAAQAAPILTFGQVGNANTVVGTRHGSTTNIATTNTAVTVSQIDGALATPFSAVLNFSFDSVSAATTVSGSILQDFSGTFCITSAANCGGTNFLSGSLIDVAFGAGAAFNLSATTPPANNVTFTSSVIPGSDLGLQRGASFSFANVTPALSIQANTIDAFTSSVSGTFSANIGAQVPEPASLALLGAGLIGLGSIRRRRQG